jgi:hypothetical protein
MAIIRIAGIPGWEGDYPLDLAYFTNRELHEIQQVAGVRVGEMEEEFSRGNNDLIVAVAAVAIRRSGRRPDVDALWDAVSGSIVLADEDEEGVVEDDPPTSPPSSGGSDGRPESGTGESSGHVSVSTGDVTQETILPSIGIRDSAIGSG